MPGPPDVPLEDPAAVAGMLQADTTAPHTSKLWDGIISTIARAERDSGWRAIKVVLAATADDDALCWAGVAILEGFIANHPDFVFDHLDEVSGMRNFRAALSCVIWPDKPAELDRRLWEIAPARGTPDDVGGRRS